MVPSLPLSGISPMTADFKLFEAKARQVWLALF
jgi:hypothetical protein